MASSICCFQLQDPPSSSSHDISVHLLIFLDSHPVLLNLEILASSRTWVVQSELLPYVSDYTQSFNKILQPPFCVVAPPFFTKTFYFILFFIIIIPPGNPRSTGQKNEKNETFIWLFLKDFFTTGCLGWLKEVYTHRHSKVCEGAPGRRRMSIKKLAPFFFSSSFPFLSTTTSTSTLHN